MEQKTWIVHFVMEASEKPVQNQEYNGEKQSKKRSQADKVGKLKYLLQQNREIKGELTEIKIMVRTLLESTEAHYDQPTVERLACENEIDREILQVLFEAGSPGLLPKDAAAKLKRFNINRHHVRRRLLRMNRRLQKKIKRSIVERRGWHWALTSFALEAYGASLADDSAASGSVCT